MLLEELVLFCAAAKPSTREVNSRVRQCMMAGCSVCFSVEDNERQEAENGWTGVMLEVKYVDEELLVVQEVKW